MKKIFLALFIIHCHPSFSQKKLNRPIEISPYLTSSISFSELKNRPNKNFKSPPAFNPFNIGVKVERQFFKEKRGIFLNTAISDLGLSVSGRFKIRVGKRSTEQSMTAIPNYTLLSLGFKKLLNMDSSKNIKLISEIGIRAHFANSSGGTAFGYKAYISDSLIQSEFTPYKTRAITIIPYIGLGYEYTHKKARIGVLLWFQRGLQPIDQYNFTVSEGSSFNYQDKAISYGMAAGVNVYVKVISF
jgi:hypothetical protein